MHASAAAHSAMSCLVSRTRPQPGQVLSKGQSPFKNAESGTRSKVLPCFTTRLPVLCCGVISEVSARRER